MRLTSHHFSANVHLPARARVARPPRSVRVNGANSNGQPVDQPPIGCSRYSVALKKPLGIVLEQDVKSGSIFVAEIKPDGSASRNGRVKVGDQLIATSGVIYTKESDYGGAMVKGGQQVVRLRVQGESFKTVSAAIGSHPGHIAVTLELQRCEAGLERDLGVGVGETAEDGTPVERITSGK